jgi:hypothetical protein
MRVIVTRRVWIIIGSSFALLAIAGWWLAGRSPHWSVTGDCPDQLGTDPARAERVVAQLGRVAAGRALLDRAPQPLNVCFTQGALGVVRSDGVFVLPATWEDAEVAARLGHLLLHRIEGPPLPDSIPEDADCSLLVQRAVRAEVEAHLLEASLRRELGVTRARDALAFEAALWDAPPVERASVVERFLTTSQTRPSLAAQYEQRCRTAQREAK